MAGVLQHLRSSTLNKRPNPASMVDGQVAINYASGSPGMFFKDSNGSLVKVGPVHVGSTAPNVSPASGGTAGNSLGEQWLDTSGGTYVFKIWDGGSWRSEAGEFVNSTGDTMTGSLTMGPSASLIFEGSTDDGFETTLTVVNPTVDRTITLPNVTGTVITTGDTGTVTSTMLLDGTILNADVNASAAIAGTKISPDFGSQTITTTGIVSAALGAAAAPSITFTGDTNTGIYSPGADRLAISTGGSGRLFVDASGRLLVGTSNSRNVGSLTAPISLFESNIHTIHAIVSNNSTGGTLSLGASGGSTLGSNTIVSSGQSLGAIRFVGADGTDMESFAASIVGEVDGTPGANDMPGRLVFLTTADGASTSNERLRITSAGLVGIGTSSPGALLDLAGNNTGLTSPLNATNRLRFTDTDTTQTNDQPTGTIEWYTSDTDSPGVHAYISTDMFNSGTGALVIGTGSGGSASERVRIDQTGRVGIGTTSASNNLEVRTSGVTTLQVANTGNSSLTITAESSGESRLICGGNNSFLTVHTGTSPTERARIDSSGRLLVGTTSASTAATAVLQGNSGGSTSHAIINLARGVTNPGINLSLGFAQFQDSAGSVGAQIYAQTDAAWSAESYAGRLVFSTTADGASSPTERMRIDSRGAVRTGNNTLYTGTTGAVTGSTGTTVFTFDFTGTTTRHTALVKLSVMHLVATNSIAAQPAAEYIFAVEGYTTGVSAATTPTAAFQNVYVAATHFAFADTGNTSFTITLTNPSASAASAVYYKVEVLDNEGALNLSSVTTT